MTDTVGAVLTRPSIDVATAAEILWQQWGIRAELRPLPSERDRNWAVVPDGEERFVLKVSNDADDPTLLEFQHGAMARLDAAGVPCQLPLPALDGSPIVSARTPDGRRRLVRLLTWLPGRPLASVPTAARSTAMLRDLGWVMGRTARALDGWDHEAAHRPFQWNAVQGVEVIETHRGAIEDERRVALLKRWRPRFERLRDTLPTLRQGVIHNDANDHNILVDADADRVSGLLDLGDSVWSVVLNELAVAVAYAALGADDPLVVTDAVREGFESALPLTDDERAVLPDLIALRLATSVALSAHQARLDPDDAYLTVSEAAAWTLLERLADG
jgi:Ser/Thr protein kinase RdoA (MazF antagonist)